MPVNNNNISKLHDLLVDEARRFSSAESHLSEVLPRWIETARSFQLKAMLQKYLGQVQEHIYRLDVFFQEQNLESIICINRVMLAITEDAGDRFAQCADTEVRDACLLSCIQLINHFKISVYGTAAAFAETLGNAAQAAMFHEMEVSEKQIDDRLSQLAIYEINKMAKAPIALPE